MEIFSKIEVILGDITKQKTEAIVNAANNSLLGGGGVDGAIHRAAGAELKKECETLGGCETGKAKITKGYQLPAKFVIHTVGPIWRGGNCQEHELLASCYEQVLKIALNYNIRTISFPSISTGAYNFPLVKAAEIALTSITEFLKETSAIDAITIVCFDRTTLEVYQKMLETLKTQKKEH